MWQHVERQDLQLTPTKQHEKAETVLSWHWNFQKAFSMQQLIRRFPHGIHVEFHKGIPTVDTAYHEVSPGR